MAERISDASKDVFWYMLCCFCFVVFFFGYTTSKVPQRERMQLKYFKKTLWSFLLPGWLCSWWLYLGNWNLQESQVSPNCFFFLIFKCQPVIAQYLFFGELSAMFPDFQSRERLIRRERREGLVFLRKEVVRFLWLLPLNHHLFPKK